MSFLHYFLEVLLDVNIILKAFTRSVDIGDSVQPDLVTIRVSHFLGVQSFIFANDFANYHNKEVGLV